MADITEESILPLNNGSVNFEEARALFNVDLSTFKARLEQLNIFTWKFGESLVRIHGGDYEITIVIKNMRRCYVVQGRDSYEDVFRMIEETLKLSPGCYKLTYKHSVKSIGNVWVKTDHDWHIAVLLAKMNGYTVVLNLEVFPSSQTAVQDACVEDACVEDDFDEDDFDEDAFDEDASDEDASDENVYVEDACDENSKEPFTKEDIIVLNNGTMTFEDARALLNVDLSTFKARLEQLNIFTWKVGESLVRIHGGDYEITIVIKNMRRCYVVQGRDSYEDVFRMIEDALKLSPGCYKLTYKHSVKSIGNVWVKTDRDWHIAVLIAKMNGYTVVLNLEVFPSSQTAVQDAFVEGR